MGGRNASEYAYIDKNMFGQAFLHVVINAIKYCTSDETGEGNIWFEIEYKNIENQLFAKMIICNIGPKIPPHEQKIIFQKKVSGEYARKTGKAGKGLGLYVAQVVMKNLKGSVVLETSREDCTTFSLNFPIYHKKGKRK